MTSQAPRTLLAALLLCLLPLAAAAESPQDDDLPKLLAKAAAGDLDACRDASYHYMLQEPPDYVSAFFWGKKAALAGHVGAQIQVGLTYWVQGDNDRAILWTKLAADRGHVGAQFSLASYYSKRDDTVQATKYLILASSVDQDAAFYLYWNALGATAEERQLAEQQAKAWKPVCPGACRSVWVLDKCDLCPLTEEEKSAVEK
jgi:hypothetical protein